MTSEQRVRDFIVDELKWTGPKEELTNDFPLIDEHVVDSMGLFRIILWLESEFGLKLADEEIDPEHFGTINDIAGLIDAKD